MKNENFKIKNLFLLIFLIGAFFSPLISSAAGLVPCGGDNEPSCQFCHLFVMFDGIIRFILFNVIPPIGAFLFVWAGVLLLFAADNPQNVAKAKNLFSSVAVGLIIIFSAWLLVGLFLSTIGLSAMGELLAGPDKWFRINCSAPGIPQAPAPQISWESVKDKPTQEILDNYPQFIPQLAERELPRHKELVLEYLERYPQDIWNQYYDAHAETIWIKPYAVHDAKYNKQTGKTSITNLRISPNAGYYIYSMSNDRASVEFEAKPPTPKLSGDETYVPFVQDKNNHSLWVATARDETLP